MKELDQQQNRNMLRVNTLLGSKPQMTAGSHQAEQERVTKFIVERLFLANSIDLIELLVQFNLTELYP